MGPWAAISDYPYISIVMANDPDEIHAPIVDIVDSTTDEPEVEPTHELIALAPDMARELLRLHGGIEVIRDYCAGNARSARAAGMHTLANEMYATVKALAELLEGDTE